MKMNILKICRDCIRRMFSLFSAYYVKMFHEWKRVFVGKIHGRHKPCIIPQKVEEFFLINWAPLQWLSIFLVPYFYHGSFINFWYLSWSEEKDKHQDF